jgi:hypothetical protein
MTQLEAQTQIVSQVRTELRLNERSMEDRVNEIGYLRSKMERMLHEREVISLIRQEYQVQGA